MKKRIALALIFAMFIFSTSTTSQVIGYSSDIESGRIVFWNVEIATNFTMWYTGGGYCAVENESIMTFDITSVDDEIFGVLSLGNVSVPTNDTVIALDLTLGVWPTWLTGLFVEVGQSNIDSLNETAYAVAERVSGNLMNGTMTSQYDNISVGQTILECIVFDYEQDPPGTQKTHLAYSLSSGVLVEADTTVTFGSTYRLVLSLVDVMEFTHVDLTADYGGFLAISGMLGGALVAVVIVVYVKLSRSK